MSRNNGRRSRTARLCALVLLAAGAVAEGGCVGSIGDRAGGDGNGSGPAVDGAHPGLDVASSAIRRMTPNQYVNSVRDLLGDADLELDLDADTGQAVTLLGAQKLNAAADYVASRSDVWGATVFPCDTTGDGSSACADELIATLGRRAFRRPLDDDEKAWLRGVYDAAKAEQTFQDSLLVVVQVILQAPQFVYFLELGTDQTSGLPAGVRPLSGFERATRLSFFLWNTIPDEELLGAAESGELDTMDGVQAQAARLLADPRAHGMAKDLYVGWLQLDGTPTQPGLEEGTKNPDLFPEDSPALRAAMRQELEALVERVVFEQNGTVETLLTTTDAYVNGPLAALYGVDGPADATTFEWVKLPADERAGLFTRAAFLGMYAGPTVKSPIRRGAFLVKKALCVELGKPPPNANDTPVTGGSVDENGKTVHKTVRQDVEGKTSTGVCAGCHSIINPVGFAFENFDALGKWQTKETGEDETGPFSLDIDASGALPVLDEHGSVTPDKVAVNGAVEMSKALAQSPALTSCMASRWFETALHRDPDTKDQTSVDVVSKALAGGATFSDVVSTLVTSDAFLFLRPRED